MSNVHLAAAAAHEAAATAWEAQIAACEAGNWRASDAASEIAAELTQMARKYSRRAQKALPDEASRKAALTAVNPESPSDIAPEDHRAAAEAHRLAAY